MNRVIDLADYDFPVEFQTPNWAEGHMIEHAFAGLYDGTVLRRCYDSSDGSTTYHIANYDPADITEDNEDDYDWEPCELINRRSLDWLRRQYE